MTAERAAQLVDALNRHVRIEQAKGVLAQVHAVNVDEAFGLLARYATTSRHWETSPEPLSRIPPACPT